MEVPVVILHERFGMSQWHHYPHRVLPAALRVTGTDPAGHAQGIEYVLIQRSCSFFTLAIAG
jgi:hypothetical protein